VTRRQRHLGLFIAALLGLTLYQWVFEGEITWHDNVLGSLPEWAVRPEAGWRQAADAVNQAAPAVPESFDIEGRVVRIADGDTLSVVDADNRQYKIRFYGIDAPERGQPYGGAARRELARLVEGKRVQLMVRDIDDYDRRVAEVYVNGISVNLAMVEAGYAWWYRYHARSRQDLERAEQEARAASRGLWSDPNPQAPWDWRRENRR
jgi:endonuclease YncB( thermonuclease family)